VKDDREEPVGLVRVGQRVSEEGDDLPDVSPARPNARATGQYI